jgi:hypothetical protein
MELSRRRLAISGVIVSFILGLLGALVRRGSDVRKCSRDHGSTASTVSGHLWLLLTVGAST